MRTLTNIVVTSGMMTNDIPMFFRVRGTTAGDLLRGLVAYYPFTGNADDASGNGQNGVVHGASLAPDRHGHANTAYAFDGSSDYVDCGLLLERYDIFSFSLWFAFDAPPAKAEEMIQNRRQSNGGGAFISFDPVLHGTEPRGTLNRGGQIVVVGNGTNVGWHHVALSCDGTTMALYCDGTFTASIPVAAGAAYSAEPLWIGRGFLSDPDGAGVRAFTGKIDEVRVYDRALTASEVQNLFHLPD